jgi:hypothetical protein
VAGSIVFSSSSVGSQIYRYTYAWTSDASGVVSGISHDLIHGGGIAATFSPGTGAAQPSNLYDVTLLCDQHGVDVLNEEGLDKSNTAGSHHAIYSYNAAKGIFFRQFIHGGGYSLSITGAGVSKSGTMEFYITHGAL